MVYSLRNIYSYNNYFLSSFLFDNCNEFDMNVSENTYCSNHDIVATGIISVPGKISLINSNDVRTLLLNNFDNKNADNGAQATSSNSPTPGMT